MSYWDEHKDDTILLKRVGVPVLTLLMHSPHQHMLETGGSLRKLLRGVAG